MDQEKIIKIQMMEQEVNHLNQQLQHIEENMGEMIGLISSLEEIENGKNILANIGKRVFVPVEIKDDKLIIEIGKGNFVKKSVLDTKEVIERENKKLLEGKEQILSRLSELQMEMNKLIMEFQKEQAQASKGKEEGIEELAEGHSH